MMEYLLEINNNMLKKARLEEGLIKKNLPNDIISSVLRNETSLGNNPALPDIYNTPYLIKILNKRFSYLKEELKEIGSISDINSNDLRSALSELIFKCKKIEKQHRLSLEKICYNFIVELFSIPEETINLKLELKDNIDFNDSTILLEPMDGDDDFEFSDIKDALGIKNEVYKRRMLLSLCMGGAMEISRVIDNYQEEISKLDRQLCDLYKKIIVINEYLLFEREELNISDKNKKQMGTVEVFLGNDENKVTIKAQGEIFPILLCETIRGFLELFISHGLPTDRQKTLLLLNKTDFLKSEPWDMRIGPSLWNILTKTFDNINSMELPYLLKRISQLNVNKFNFLMKEIFAKTQKGKNIMSLLSNKAKDDVKYNQFVDKMDKMKTNKIIITDEYIHSDEL